MAREFFDLNFKDVSNADFIIYFGGIAECITSESGVSATTDMDPGQRLSASW